MSHPYEISGVAEFDGDIFTTLDEDAQVFGVYERDEEGLAVWLVDLPTRDDAERYAEWLHNARPGWITEHCDETTDCIASDPQGHTFPPEGAEVVVTTADYYREAGADTEYHVATGTRATVMGYVAEWHDVHVRITREHSVLDVWVDPTRIAPA